MYVFVYPGSMRALKIEKTQTYKEREYKKSEKQHGLFDSAVIMIFFQASKCNMCTILDVGRCFNNVYSVSCASFYFYSVLMLNAHIALASGLFLAITTDCFSSLSVFCTVYAELSFLQE